jgi:uncharacterized membrane protein
MIQIRKVVFVLSFLLILIYFLDKYDKPRQPSQFFLFELATLAGIIYVTFNYHYFEIRDRSSKRIIISIIGAIALSVLAGLSFKQQNNIVDQIVFAALILSLIVTSVQSVLYLRRRKIGSAR